MAQLIQTGRSKLVDLPAELLHVIASLLDNTSQVQLGLTCRILNHISLSTFFKQNRDLLPQRNIWWPLVPLPCDAIWALRAALWLEPFTALHLTFNSDVDMLLAQFCDLYHLIKHLPRIEVLDLRFPVTIVARSNFELDVRRWFKVVTRLLQMGIEKGCKRLCLSGGAEMTSFYSTLEPAQLPVTWTKSLNPELHVGEAWESPRVEQSRYDPPAVLRARPSLGTYGPETNNEALSIQELRSGSTIEAFTKPAIKDPESQNRILIQSIHPTKAEEGVIATAGFCSLSTVEISSNSLLFQPLFLHWTLTTLSSSRITTLSISYNSDVSKATWSTFLSFMTLPLLEELSLKASVANNTSLADLEIFFSRHPRIHTLVLTSARPPVSAAFKEAILPHLSSLTAHPIYIMSFLEMQLSHPDALLHLKCLTLEATLKFCDPTFDLNLFDAVLIRLAGFTGKKLTLTLVFMDSASTWFSKHVALGTESILCRLSCVSKLVIGCFLTGEVTCGKEALPIWLSLFPSLESVVFKGISQKQEWSESKEFLSQMATKCPGIKTIENFW